MKQIFALILVLLIGFSLAACAQEKPATDTKTTGASPGTAATSDRHTEEKTDEQTEWEPVHVMDDKVLVSDYKNQRIVVYDLSLVGEDGNLDDGEIWVLNNAYSASVKYRENTVFGNVILHTADYNASIVDYDTKKVIWASSGDAGWGVHSIEILPSGNVVTAGNTDGLIRIFNSANCVKKGDQIKSKSYYDLPGAHGVLWDPEYECLWALGARELVAYAVIDQPDGTQTLSRMQGLGGKLPSDGQGGHDLAADLTDTRYLWCTSSKVYRFDKETGEFNTKYKGHNVLNKGGVKGFGNNLNHNFFYTQAKSDDKGWIDQGNPDWTTDTICFCYWKSESVLKVKKCVSQNSAFYKARVFYGKYQ